MANVHGFKDLNNQNNRNRKNNQGSSQQYENKLHQQNYIPFITPLKNDRQPYQQTIPYTLKIVVCPDFKILSTTTAFLAIIWLLYFVCLSQGVEKGHQKVLQIQYDVLVSFGGALGTLIRQGQLHRLIIASFLHTDFVHILFNSIFLLYLCTRFQRMYPKETPYILIVSSFTGLLLSIICESTTLIVGSSTSIFGILGGLVAFLIINWTVLEAQKPARNTLVCIICVVIFISMLFSMENSMEAIAHIGGLIGGLLISLAILKGMSQKSGILTYVGLGGIIAMNFLCLLVLFFTK